MQNPPRPASAADPDKGKLPYDPIEWNRRLDKAREERARVLAAREAAKSAAEEEQQAPIPAQRPKAAPVAPKAAEAPPRRRITWRLALGFAIGIALGALALLYVIPMGTAG